MQPGGRLKRFLPRWLARWAAVALLVLTGAQAHAATLDTFDAPRNVAGVLFFTPVCNARLMGEIRGPNPLAPEGSRARLGDAAALAPEIAAFRAELDQKWGAAPEGVFPALCLFSSGGDLSEAMKLGELFQGFMMVVEEGAECLSACAILFMSAPARERVYLHISANPGRFLHYAGTLGFHAPRLHFPEKEACRLVGKAATEAERCLLTPKEAAGLATQAYMDALASVQRIGLAASTIEGGSQLPVAEHQKSKWKFADRVTLPMSRELPPDLLLAFLTVPSNDFFEITRLEEAIGYGIEITGVPPPPVLTGDMMKSACLNLSSRRCAVSPGGECSKRSVESIAVMLKTLGVSSTEELEGKFKQMMQLTLDLKTKPICQVAPDPDCSTASPERQQEIYQSMVADLGAKVTMIQHIMVNNKEDFGPYATGVTLGGKRLAPNDLAPLKASRSALWPPADPEAAKAGTGLPLYSELFTATLHDAPVCDVRATWADVDDNKPPLLIDFKIDAATMMRSASRPLTEVTDPVIDGPEANSDRYHLRPWMMLPAGTTLSDIGKSDPWAPVLQGDDFFSKPANWFRN